MKHAAFLLLLWSSLASASGAPDDSLQALMREAFPGWAPGRFHAITVPDSDSGSVRVAVTPRLVLRPDGRHRLLVVSGTHNEGSKAAVAAHAAEGNLGVYGFTRQGGRWVKTSDQPSIGWTGFSGDVGKLRAVTLGPGRLGLAVENASCWQGACGAWLTLYDVTPDTSREVLMLMTHSDSLNASDECPRWLDGRLRAVPEHDNRDFCFDVRSRWQLATAPGRGDADVVLHFTGREAVIDARTGKPAVKAVREALVLRRQGERYEPLRGRNPTHEI